MIHSYFVSSIDARDLSLVIANAQPTIPATGTKIIDTTKYPQPIHSAELSRPTTQNTPESTANMAIAPRHPPPAPDNSSRKPVISLSILNPSIARMQRLPIAVTIQSHRVN
jgi:hypothetical protein